MLELEFVVLQMRRNQMIKNDLNLLYEVGTMRHIERSWSQFGGIRFANIAEHSYRVLWLAMLLAKHEGGDISKILQMALIHDFSECRTGDVNYLSRSYTSRNEDLAINDAFKGTSLEVDGAELWQELEGKLTLEAKIVKDADILDCDLELQEQAALGVRMKEVLSDVRLAAANKLSTNTGRILFDLIINSDPNEWHLNARNRFTSGDWGGKK
jgi:putative hydrolases of HD superfamily